MKMTLTPQQIESISAPVTDALNKRIANLRKSADARHARALAKAEKWRVDYLRARNMYLKAAAELKELKRQFNVTGGAV